MSEAVFHLRFAASLELRMTMYLLAQIGLQQRDNKRIPADVKTGSGDQAFYAELLVMPVHRPIREKLGGKSRQVVGVQVELAEMASEQFCARDAPGFEGQKR